MHPGLGKDLLGLDGLTRSQILSVLDLAEYFKAFTGPDIRRLDHLSHVSVANLFFESSTRTRASFELAEKRLSAELVTLSSVGSSIDKGETLVDMAKNLEAMGVRLIVLRHGASGAPQYLAERIPISVVNAGDGAHQHPTQALLDMLTIRDQLGRFEGVRVCIVGDLLHSRVARSNIYGLRTLGAEVAVCGPRTLLPAGIEEMGVQVFHRLEEAIEWAEVMNLLRLQLERMYGGFVPSLAEYNRVFGVSEKRLEGARPDLLILHPGPMNRRVEIDSPVAESPRAFVLQQVRNGVAVRMAVLYLLTGGDPDALTASPQPEEME